MLAGQGAGPREGGTQRAVHVHSHSPARVHLHKRQRNPSRWMIEFRALEAFFLSFIIIIFLVVYSTSSDERLTRRTPFH